MYRIQTCMLNRSYSTVYVLSPTEWSVHYHNFMNNAPINSASLVAVDQCYLGFIHLWLYIITNQSYSKVSYQCKGVADQRFQSWTALNSMLHISCNINTNDLPDKHTLILGLWVYMHISQSLVFMLQLLAMCVIQTIYHL